EERRLREVEPYAVVPFTDDVGDGPVEVVGPVPVEAPLNDQFDRIGVRGSRNLHQRYLDVSDPPITRSALAISACGSVRPIARAASRLTLIFVVFTSCIGMVAMASPRMMRAAICADSRPPSS